MSSTVGWQRSIALLFDEARKAGTCPRLSLRRANVLGTVVEQTGQDDFTLLPTVSRADGGDGGTAYLFRQRQVEADLHRMKAPRRTPSHSGGRSANLIQFASNAARKFKRHIGSGRVRSEMTISALEPIQHPLQLCVLQSKLRRQLIPEQPDFSIEAHCVVSNGGNP